MDIQEFKAEQQAISRELVMARTIIARHTAALLNDPKAPEYVMETVELGWEGHLDEELPRMGVSMRRLVSTPAK